MIKHGPYTIQLLRRKNQKRIIIRKLSEDKLKITAPKNVRQQDIKATLNRHLKTVETLPIRLDFKQLLNRPKYLEIFGQRYAIAYQKGPKAVKFNTQGIILSHPTLSLHGLKQTLYDFLKDQLFSYIKAYHHSLESNHKNIHLFPKIIKTRYMHTRFGSAKHEDKTINLNLALIHYPKRFLNSVYLHELTHFNHPNHSQAFYKALTRLNPDYLEDKKALESYHMDFQNRMNHASHKTP